MQPSQLTVEDLGRISYAQAYEVQTDRVERVLEARRRGTPVVGSLLLLEHDPVITVSKRPGARSHLLATPDLLERAGVRVEQTDRGGDITYHGPGQLVAYPILDLNHLRLRLHEYMRLLEAAVIDACEAFGVPARRDPDATGVWVDRPSGDAAKVCAMGVRVRRWISMHGLALNVETNLDHFDLIVPCGLAGRSVTSLRRLLGDDAPSLEQAKGRLVSALRHRVESRVESASHAM